MIRNELRCNSPPCPWQKCVILRDERFVGGCCNADTPPERPTFDPDNPKENKCACKSYSSGPNNPSKCDPHEGAIEDKANCTADDECNTGKGCCNTDRNFLSFMINVVCFIAFMTIGILIFWLKMSHWAVILCLKVYASNRTTQVAVASGIGLLLLTMICTYAMGHIKSSGQTKNRAPCKGPNCNTEVKEYTVTITDDKAREIYKQSKLYAVPIDMTKPPALLVYLRNNILKEA
ncbi:uncharacterized protein LOC129239479 [Anastrepha obliqua]|uniref:uncharacterized protein LOC129239479 n=1 Tax=Anastrepha obliqua TaxID=95512 RepID=UPI002409D56F|nr:uncharacterized protein LOC129239479 [Anastrepha obliqua]